MVTRADRVFFKDRQSRFLMVSTGWALDHAPGHSVDELIGMSDFDFFSGEHARRAFADEQRIIRTGEDMPAKIEHLTYDDRPDAWVSTTKHPLHDDEGHIVGTFGISCDVTAQVLAERHLAESEERFRSIFDQAPLGILRLDAQGRIVDANRALCEIVGRPLGRARRQPAGRPFRRRRGRALAGRGQAGRGHAGRGEAGPAVDAPRSSQHRARRPDGTTRVVQVNDVVVHDKQGGAHTLVATVEDITDSLRLADDLRQAQQMEALGQLAAGIAHEINTPTQFISDNLSFLSDIWGPVVKLLAGS